MQIVHPQTALGSLPPDDVFLAVDDMGMELGRGYIIYQFQPNLYPDCPINLYFSIEGQATAFYMLFGALLARARQLREARPDLRARVYTNIAPADARLRDFYVQNGFDCEDAEHLVELTMPVGDGRIPMSCTVAKIPLNNQQDVQALLMRMAQNDLNYLDEPTLYGMMQQPHFLALGLYRNADLIGEILMVGQGDACELSAMYIIPPMRRQGMGRALLHRSMAVMAAEGVTQVRARQMSRSDPQRRLMSIFGSKVLGTTALYPGLYL